MRRRELGRTALPAVWGHGLFLHKVAVACKRTAAHEPV